MKTTHFFRILCSSIAIVLLLANCKKDDPLFDPVGGSTSSEEGDMLRLETWQDTLAWIEAESKNREVHTDYLQEMPDKDAVVSGTKTIEVISPMTGKTVEMTAQLIDGQLVAEGDMVFGTESEYRERKNKAVLRGVVSSSNSNKWPYGVIPYVIQSNHPNRNAILEGINMANGTTLTLKPRSNEADYVYFRSSSVNNSHIGRIGGRQIINISSNAVRGVVVHEIFHAAGLFHEQSSCRRDDYVSVKWGNITSGKGHNFNKQCSGTFHIDHYNFSSIMHYGPFGFSKNGEATLLPSTGNPFTWLDQYFKMGQRSRIEGSDYWAINYMYPVIDNHNFKVIPKHSHRSLFAAGQLNETVVQRNFPVPVYNTLRFEKAGDGYYYIKHLLSGKYLGVKDASTANVAPVVLQNFQSGAHHQQFKLELSNTDTHRIRVRHSGKYLDIESRSTASGARLIQYSHHGGTNQQFYIRRL